MLDQTLASRLKSKTVKDSIVLSIARDFNLTPILANAYFSQISDYFLHHAEVKLSSGEFHYLAGSNAEHDTLRRPSNVISRTLPVSCCFTKRASPSIRSASPPASLTA